MKTDREILKEARKLIAKITGVRPLQMHKIDGNIIVDAEENEIIDFPNDHEDATAFMDLIHVLSEEDESDGQETAEKDREKDGSRL